MTEETENINRPPYRVVELVVECSATMPDDELIEVLSNIITVSAYSFVYGAINTVKIRVARKEDNGT